jgi:transposase
MIKGLQQVPEFGPQTVAVLRAELGDVQRFSRTDEVIAYGGMDIEIKESGLWKGKAKLSKRGSGLVRRMLYMAALRSISDDRFGLWRLLSAPGGAWSQERLGSDGRHAQNAGGSSPLTHA